MAENTTSKKKCYYGSGRVYDTAYIESEFPKIKDVTKITAEEAAAVIAFIAKYGTESNEIGYLKEGYEAKIDATNFEDESDLGQLAISALIKEKGTVNFKLFNANAETIAKLYPTAAHGFDATSGFGFTEVGGIGNLDDTEHVIIFKHDDKQYGDTVVICVGKNVTGFSTLWKQGSVEPFACQYSLLPYNDSGRLLLYVDCKQGHVWADAANSGT